MRQRLDAVTSFLAWSTTILSASTAPDRDGCRIIMRREAQARQGEALFAIDIVSAADDIRPGSYPAMPGNVVHAVVSEETLTAQLAANLRLVQAASGSISYALARQVLAFELTAGTKMTRAVLEARLVKRGFGQAEVANGIVSLLGDRSLHADFRKPISGGSLVWRRQKDQKPNHEAMPWDQVLAYCSSV